MTFQELNFSFQLGVSIDWLRDCDNAELSEYIYLNNIDSFDAKIMREIRRKFRMRNYRIESYYKKTILHLNRVKEELIETKESLESEIIFYKESQE